MSEHDVIAWGPPPEDKPGKGAFGAAPVRCADGSWGVTIMLKGFRVGRDVNGEPFVAIDYQISGAVQAVQALRQAIALARKGRGR